MRGAGRAGRKGVSGDLWLIARERLAVRLKGNEHWIAK